MVHLPAASRIFSRNIYRIHSILAAISQVTFITTSKVVFARLENHVFVIGLKWFNGYKSLTKLLFFFQRCVQIPSIVLEMMKTYTEMYKQHYENYDKSYIFTHAIKISISTPLVALYERLIGSIEPGP